MHHVDNFTLLYCSSEYQFEIKIPRSSFNSELCLTVAGSSDPPLAPAMGANYVRSRTKKD